MKSLLKKIFPSQARKSLRKAERRLKGLFLGGSRVHCPVCDKGFSTFLAAGNPPRPNALCPNCGSLERHRLIWLYLRQKSGFFSPAAKRLLHFAPEEMFRRNFSALAQVDYVTADLSEPGVDVRCDIQSLPFGDNDFDVILCSHVLEHVPDDGRAMRELYRVMKPGGWAIIQVPLGEGLEKTLEDPALQSEEERLKAYGQIDHVRLYGRDYYDRLREAGFSVSQENFLGEFRAEERARYGLQTDEDICLCTKQILPARQVP